MAKKFTGSWLIVIILIILCWPAALIYVFIKYEEQQLYGGMNYGGGMNNNPGYAPGPAYGPSTTCSRCGTVNQPGAQYCQSCGNRMF